MKANYSTIDTKKIAEKLGFSVGTVRCKAGKLGLIKEIKGTTARPVISICIDTGTITKYTSVKDAINSGVCNRRVYQVLRGDKKYHKGCTWEYA